jgi:hypothetical protein
LLSIDFLTTVKKKKPLCPNPKSNWRDSTHNETVTCQCSQNKNVTGKWMHPLSYKQPANSLRIAMQMIVN